MPLNTLTRGHLQLHGIEKTYPGADRPVIGPLDLEIEPGQFVSILGPSGCGKSTLLAILAGLSDATAGHVTLDGAEVTGPGRDRGVVFQQHVLLPWLTARGNVEFALRDATPPLSAAQRRQVALEYLDKVHLGHAAEKTPAELSGGMQQRVGIARALALAPPVLLLDEPFGALDALTKLSIHEELLNIWEEDSRTVVMITHDVDEALRLSDRIIVLSSGPEAQIIHDVLVPARRPRHATDMAHNPVLTALRTELLEALLPRPS